MISILAFSVKNIYKKRRRKKAFKRSSKKKKKILISFKPMSHVETLGYVNVCLCEYVQRKSFEKKEDI